MNLQLGILAWDREEPETQDLVLAGEELGHDTTLFTIDDIDLHLSTGGVTAYVNGRDLSTLDLIVSRAQIRTKLFASDADRLHLLSRAGARIIEAPAAFLTSESKIQTMIRLGEAGVPIADTYLCHTFTQISALIDHLGQVVIKPSNGYGGTDVELVNRETRSTLRSGIEGMLDRYGSLLCQEYLPHPQGDLRVTLAGDVHLFSITRIPNVRCWKANVSMGADWQRLDPPIEAVHVARRAVEAVGIFLAGVDLVAVPGGYVVLEVNNCPGWYMLPHDMRKTVSFAILSAALERLEGLNVTRIGGPIIPDRPRRDASLSPSQPKGGPS